MEIIDISELDDDLKYLLRPARLLIPIEKIKTGENMDTITKAGVDPTTKSQKLCHALVGVASLKDRFALIIEALKHPVGIFVSQTPENPDEILELPLENLISEGSSILNTDISACKTLLTSIQTSLGLQIESEPCDEVDPKGVLAEFYYAIDDLACLEERIKVLLSGIINEDVQHDNEFKFRTPNSLETLLESGSDRINEIVDACHKHIDVIITKLF